MGFLKSLATTLMTMLLFLSLAAFGTLFALSSTLLDPDFVVAQVDRLDVAALAREMTETQVSGQVPSEQEFLEEALYDAIEKNEPELKEEASRAIYSGYDYLLGETERLSLTISLAPLRQDLRDNLWRLFQQNLDRLPPEVAAAPPEVAEQYFEDFYRQAAQAIPSELVVDEDSIPPEVMAPLALVRETISYAETAYYALIGLMAVLVAGIILLHRSVKGATRELGVTFLIYGALDYAGVWLSQNYQTSLPLPDLPPSLEVWMAGLVNDLIAPMQTLAIGLMVGGAALIIISILYPRWRRKEEE
jgi:hypothetical protein